MSSTETRPVESDADTGEGDGYAHYARKDEIAAAIEVAPSSHFAVADSPDSRSPTLSGLSKVQGISRHVVGPWP